MLAFIVRRAPAGPADDLGDLGPVLRHHPAAARRFRRRLHRATCRPRQRRSRRQEAQALRQLYGLDQPYLRPVRASGWRACVAAAISAMSMEWQRPVTEVIGDRLWLTIVVSFAALLLTWGIALPIGIYSAVRQYSVGDYVFTFLGFIGLAVPNFLLALIIMYLGVPLVRRQRRRAVLGRVSSCALELGQGLGSDVAPAAAGAHPGARRHRAADPHHARQPARRAAQALCRHGARQGPAGDGA